MKFNAGVLLTDEEVRQLTETGSQIYPMKWVDTDKNASLRRDNDCGSVPAKYMSRLVSCSNFETTEGLRTDSPAGDVDSQKIVCSWCAQAHVSTHACDFTIGYFQGQEIDRILLYRIPAEGIPEEGIAGGEILASRVLVHGTKDAGRGLWLRLKNTCKHFKISLNSADSVHASKRGIKNLCFDVFECGRLAVWLSLGVATILGWQRRTRYLQVLWKRVSTKRRFWHSRHSQRQH